MRIFLLFYWTVGKRHAGGGAILVGQGMGMCEEMHTTGKKLLLIIMILILSLVTIIMNNYDAIIIIKIII